MDKINKKWYNMQKYLSEGGMGLPNVKLKQESIIIQRFFFLFFF